jgi:exonuclease SbcC
VDLSAERRRLTQLLVDARAAVAALESERARLAETRAQAATWREHAEVAGMLGNLLRTDAFERWLLDEALTDLVDRANVRLRELTGGQYSLTAADGAFRVVDHRNADEVRDARSLSGGETFLTSLSLALALADSSVDAAAQGGEPIESIFLDEGFGTLDPTTLDVVASAIEELGASGRLVGVVSHVADLAERLPVRFEVVRSGNSSTIQRIDR